MYDALVPIHTMLGYVVFLAVVAATGWALLRARSDAPFVVAPFSLTMVLIDVQVTFGILMWVLGRGWTFGGLVGWVHPVVMLGALAAGHVGLGRARAAGSPSRAHREVSVGLTAATTLVAVGIAVASMG